jgi:hypothetical protein
MFFTPWMMNMCAIFSPMAWPTCATGSKR